MSSSRNHFFKKNLLSYQESEFTHFRLLVKITGAMSYVVWHYWYNEPRELAEAFDIIIYGECM
jgi:hypothetical protein